MVSVSVCHASVYFRKMEIYQHAIDLSPPVLRTGSPKVVHVLSCLCDNACERSLAICHKNRHCIPLDGFSLSLYSLHVLNRDVNMIQIQNNPNHPRYLPYSNRDLLHVILHRHNNTWTASFFNQSSALVGTCQ